MAPTSTDASVSSPFKSKVLISNKCYTCKKVVRNGILCDNCDFWFHFRCAKIAEDEIPDENCEWLCALCNNGLESGSKMDTSPSPETLQAIVNSLREENCALITEIRRLKDVIVASDFDLSKTLEDEAQGHVSNQGKPSLPRRWEAVSSKNSFRAKCLTYNEDFPHLSNRFDVLASTDDTDVEPARLTYSRPRASSKVSRIRSNRKIRLYMDSQGRNVALKLRERCLPNHEVCSIIKPGATFSNITKDCLDNSQELHSKDTVVFLVGTNDVAKNSAKEFIHNLRRKLQHLQHTKVLVFNIPLRYDLPDWSCVNKEVLWTNVEIDKTCKHFKNCTVIDLSSLGNRFHTKHGLHLNEFGKRFVVDMIMENLDKIKPEDSEPIPGPVLEGVKPTTLSFLEIGPSQHK